MALFGRRSEPESRGFDPAENVVLLAGIRLGAHGIPTTVLPGTDGLDTVLVDSSGRLFPLRNLMALVIPLSPKSDEFRNLLIAHIDSTVEAMSGPPIEELSESEWLERVRIRLLPEAVRDDLPAKYAQQVVPGLVAVLCIDSPHSIAFVSDSHLEGRNIRSLFDAGFRNVMSEPIDDIEEVAPGIHVVEGSSMFIATKMIGIRNLIGSVLPAAPNGVIVGVPQRHLMFVHPLAGEASFPVIGQIAGIVAGQANDDAPGGPVSASVYFWKDDVFEFIGGPSEAGGINIYPTERLTAALGLE